MLSGAERFSPRRRGCTDSVWGKARDAYGRQQEPLKVPCGPGVTGMFCFRRGLVQSGARKTAVPINHSWSDPSPPFLWGRGCALHPSGQRSPGFARGLGQGHTLVPASACARILGCCLVLGAEQPAVCSQFAVTAMAGPVSPCKPSHSPDSWPGPPVLGVSPELPPDPNGHISGRLLCACVCWDPGCLAPAPIPVLGAACPPCGLA